MPNYADLLQPDVNQPAHSLFLIDETGLEEWLSTLSDQARTLITAQKFRAKANEIAILASDNTGAWFAAIGVKDVENLGPWCLAHAAETLPAGTYRIAHHDIGVAGLGWLTAQYSFTRYRKKIDTIGPRILLSNDTDSIAHTIGLAQATGLVRDLVNTPASDMGPADIESEAQKIADEFEAELSTTEGEILEQHYPMIHAVGRAADPSYAPRLIELQWGNPAHPRVAIIGKGICFDSGGLDIKPSSAMRLMKKDMGGAAHALALARLVMSAKLPVRLHLLIPAAENAVGSGAFRPGDVLKSRKGLTVEIGNTDAEGRLVLGDTLTKAGEDEPELIIDFATLTGAARVALGPDLPALFCNDDTLAQQFVDAGIKIDDPLWQLPLWDGYADMIKSDIADINNAGEGGFAGAITAALFLKRFVPKDTLWAHVDTFAWRPSAKAGRPKGGEALGLRAAFSVLRQRYGRSNDKIV